ncbi:MAG: biopolymer transporter ExbD [Candidatus Omnitrophota bacterium]
MFERSYSTKRFGMKMFYSFFFGNLFLLIVFFLVFLPKAMKPCGFSVELARAISCEPISGKDCVVSILRDNSFYLNDQKVTLEELMHFVVARKNAFSNTLIKADQNANVGALIKVWDLFRDAGAEKINIVTNE